VFAPSRRKKLLVRSNTNVSPLTDDKAVQSALECILVERADWYSTIYTAANSLIQTKPNPVALSIGIDAIPHSVAKIIRVVKVKRSVAQDCDFSYATKTAGKSALRYPENAVAIIGMAGRFPGADNVEEYWNLLTAGNAMFSKAPEARFGPSARTTKDQVFMAISSKMLRVLIIRSSSAHHGKSRRWTLSNVYFWSWRLSP
jgi:hypothetical protein